MKSRARDFVVMYPRHQGSRVITRGSCGVDQGSRDLSPENLVDGCWYRIVEANAVVCRPEHVCSATSIDFQCCIVVWRQHHKRRERYNRIRGATDIRSTAAVPQRTPSRKKQQSPRGPIGIYVEASIYGSAGPGWRGWS